MQPKVLQPSVGIHVGWAVFEDHPVLLLVIEDPSGNGRFDGGTVVLVVSESVCCCCCCFFDRLLGLDSCCILVWASTRESPRRLIFLSMRLPTSSALQPRLTSNSSFSILQMIFIRHHLIVLQRFDHLQIDGIVNSHGGDVVFEMRLYIRGTVVKVWW